MASLDSSHGVSRVVRHRDFYLRGGDMTVTVENHLYRIHSYFFHRESPFFRQMFGESNDDVREERGTTDQNAYTLDDVKSEDFARFLWVFYNPKYSVYDAPLESWLKIIQLADRWMFDNIKELSVRELEKLEMDPVEKIATYHDNKISRLYLVPSYIAVSKRDNPLTLLEGNKLGMETTIRLVEARERLRQQAFGRGIRSPTSEDFDDAAAESLVREIFNLSSRSSSAPAPATAATAPATATATAPAVTTPASIPTSTSSINGTSHGAVRTDPAPLGNSSRTNGTPLARVSGAWAAGPGSSSLDSSSTSASTTPPHARNNNTANGRANGGNTTNSNVNPANATSGHTSATTSRAANGSPSTNTESKVSGAIGSTLNKFNLNFPNTTFRQAKEQLRRGDGVTTGK